MTEQEVGQKIQWIEEMLMRCYESSVNGKSPEITFLNAQLFELETELEKREYIVTHKPSGKMALSANDWTDAAKAEGFNVRKINDHYDVFPAEQGKGDDELYKTSV